MKVEEVLCDCIKEREVYEDALDKACKILFDEATVMEVDGEYRFAKSPESWKNWLLTGKMFE